MLDKIKHTHKLKRLKYKSGVSVFFCVLDCNFKISVPLALGKKTICWRCGEEFLMNEYSIRLVRPHCSSCHKSKNDKDIKLWEKEASGEPIKEDIKDLVKTMSLSERLSQTINQSKEEEEEL